MKPNGITILHFILVLIVLGHLRILADWKQAVAYYNQGKYDKSIQEIKPVVETNPTWETGHRILGLSYLNTKKYDLAESSLARAIQLKSTSWSVYFGLAEAYEKLEKFDKIPEVLGAGQKYAQTADEKYDLRHLRGSIHFRQKRYTDAVRDLSEAVKLKPGDFTDLHQLAASYYYGGKFDEALPLLTKAAGMKPDDPSLKNLLANSYRELGVAELKNKQYAKAVDDLNKAIEFNPKDGSTHYNLGLAYQLSSKYENAEQAFHKAEELLPNNFDVYNWLGYIYEKGKKYPEALTSYKKAYEIKKDPKIKASIDRVTEALNPGQ